MLASLFKYGFWIMPPILQAVIALKMMRSKLVRTFPVFFAYVVFHIIRALILFVIYHQPDSAVAYFLAYWTAEAVDMVFGMVLIYELYSDLLRNYEGIRTLSALLFRWSFAVLLVVAAVSAAAAPGTEVDKTMAGILVLDRSVAVVRGGLLFLLFVFSAYFRLRWRSYSFGIALGLALYITVELAAVTMRSQFGDLAADSYAFVKSAAYNCAVVIWMGYFLAKEPVRETSSFVPSTDLEQWNEALLGLLRR